MRNSLLKFLKEECRKDRERRRMSSKDCDDSNFKDDVDRLLNIIQFYISSVLSDSKKKQKELEKDINSCSAQQIRSRIWEAQLYKYLKNHNLNLTSQNKGQPDFVFDNNGQRIWIEATTPEPKNIPNFRNGFVAEKEFMLRWTSAINTKKDKFNKYICKHIIEATDITIIAISSIGMEGYYPTFDSHPTGLPYAVKAVYGIGGLVYNTTTDTFERVQRDEILKPSGINIPSDVFVNNKHRSEYKHVSAILAADTSIWSVDHAKYVLIHNPNTKNRSPAKFLNVDEEWQASLDINNGIYYIKKI